MKNLKILFASLLLSSAAYAQTNIDVVETTEKIENVREALDGTLYNTKQIIKTERIKPVVLDSDDRYELNQSLVMVPVNVTKTIMLDFDRDDAIDREIVVSYKDDYDMSLDVELTPYGIVFTNDDVDEVRNLDNNYVMFDNRITRKGIYEVTLEDGQVVEFHVDDYEIK